jgi:single-strand DNA-binding protein
MASFNKVILVGNLTRDPEIKQTQSGGAVAKFAIAVNRKTKGGDETTFVDIVAWDSEKYKLAEICGNYLKKGNSVLVEGRLVIRSYEDKDGNKRKSTEVVIDQMQMLTPRSEGDSSSGAYASAPKTASRSYAAAGGRHTTAPDPLDEELDNEIPF